jgi:hypothetical protein
LYRTAKSCQAFLMEAPDREKQAKNRSTRMQRAFLPKKKPEEAVSRVLCAVGTPRVRPFL